MSADTMTQNDRQRLDEMASEWRSAGNVSKAVTKSVYAAYRLGYEAAWLASRKAALEEAAKVPFALEKCDDWYDVIDREETSEAILALIDKP